MTSQTGSSKFGDGAACARLKRWQPPRQATTAKSFVATVRGQLQLDCFGGPHTQCDWSTVVGWVGKHRQEQRCQAKLPHQGSFTQGLSRISVAHLSLLEHSLSMHNSTNRDLPRLMDRTRRAAVWSTPGQVRGLTVMGGFVATWTAPRLTSTVLLIPEFCPGGQGLTCGPTFSTNQMRPWD